MTLSRIIATLTALAAGVAAMPAHASVIDFENLPGLTFINNPLVYPTASFSSSSGQLYTVTQHGGVAICAVTGLTCDGTLTVNFSAAVKNLTFTSIGDNAGGANIFISVVTSGGTFSATGTSDNSFNTADLQNLSAYNNVLSIAINTNDPGGLSYDNFTFDAATTTPAVPEPATWAMMIAGFGAVGAAMRRRTKMVFAIA